MQLAAVLERHGLPASFSHFIDVAPLIEMLWADGQNQITEITIVREFLLNKIKLYREDFGFDILSTEELRNVLDYFLRNRPDPALLAELRQHAIERIQQRGDHHYLQTLTDRCVDIAAACSTHYPYRSDERVMHSEKQLLRTLLQY